jgi:tetratricopeptide (TPR) repeat protein
MRRLPTECGLVSGAGPGGYALQEASSLAGSPALDAIVQLLLSDCTLDELAALLKSDTRDILRATIVCLGRKGNMAHNRMLADLLRHADAEIACLAENSLWQIWMRAGTEWGNALLGRANDLIRDGDFERAVCILEQLSTAEPDVAEAHHQRGIALSLLERPEQAGAAFRQTLRLNRYHFSAAVSLGHACVEQCDLAGALRYYRYAIRLNPRLDEIPEVVKRLKAVVGKRRESR